MVVGGVLMLLAIYGGGTCVVRGRPPGRQGWVGQVAAGSNAHVCMGVRGEGPRVGYCCACLSTHIHMCRSHAPLGRALTPASRGGGGSTALTRVVALTGLRTPTDMGAAAPIIC